MTAHDWTEPIIAARAEQLAREEEGLIGLIPRRELAAIVATYAAGVALLALGARLTWATGRDVARITARRHRS